MSAESTYRPDIDGLRAVSVIAVLLYHAFPNTVPGGFAGVDVFFVISGYLITLILARDLSHGDFRLTRFYSRRVRRIFPALILVMAAVAFLGWLVLLEAQFQLLGKHVAGGASFTSNFLLRRETGYFDLEASQKPLLHLWSLAIEEQFYLVWPLLLLAISKTRLPLVGMLLLLSAVSFSLNVSTLARDAESAFYLPFDRAWELSCGGALAAATVASPAKLGRRSQELAGWLGLLFLLASFSFLHVGLPYPGARALLPVAGTVLLLRSTPAARANRLLAHPVPVFIGLISFPLYLWHWPLLSLDRMLRAGATPPFSSAVLLVVSTILAALTYRLFERPMRFGGHAAAKSIALCLSMALVGVSGVAVARGRIVAQSQSLNSARIEAAIRDWDFPDASLEPFAFHEGRFWRSKSGTGPIRQVMYFGDSHMEQYAPRISALIGRAPGAYPQAVFTTLGGCPPLPYLSRVKPNHDCDGFWDRAMEYSRSPEVAGVVVAASWDHYLELLEYRYTGPRNPYQDLEDMLSEFKRSGKRVYLVLKTPVGPAVDPVASLPQGLNLLHWKRNLLPGRKGMKVADIDAPPAIPTSSLREAGERAGAEIIDPVEFLCADGLCPAVDSNGEPRYFNAYHLRASFVRNQVTFLDRTLQESMPAGGR